MLAAADGPVTIVIDLNVVRAPREGDREVGGEAQTHRRAQALRPGFDRAERGCGPVQRAHEPAHLAATPPKNGSRGEERTRRSPRSSTQAVAAADNYDSQHRESGDPPASRA